MKISLKHAVVVLTAFAILGTCASSASAAGRTWGGVGFNDLGQSTVTFKVQNGRAKITSLQIIMSCRDTDDGTYSDRAFHMGNGPTDTLNRNRFHFRFDKYSGGREGDVWLNGRLNSNGRGIARVHVTALGRGNGGRIIERCHASSNIHLRRGPAR